MAFDRQREEFEARRQRAQAMGSSKRLAERKAAGILNARERVARLLDAGSFIEAGLLATSIRPDMRDKSPADGVVSGFGRIDGRHVGVNAADFTTLGSSSAEIHGKKQHYVRETSRRNGMPLVNLMECAGGRIPDIMGAAGIGRASEGSRYTHPRTHPWAAAVLGLTYGGGAFTCINSDYVVMRKGAVLAVSSSNVTSVAIAEDMDPEALGGWRLHSEVTGFVDSVVESDEEAIAQVKAFLSYMPDNASLPPPQSPSFEEATGARALDTLVPESRAKVYDIRNVIRAIADKLLLPLGWVGWQPDKKRLDVLGGMLTILVFLGSVYSLLPWLQDAASVRSDYLRGATLRTVLDNDRVRFSWLVVALCWWLQGQWNGSTSRARWVIALLIFFFGFYLHVLAVRIGLLCFYLLAGFLLLRSAANPAHRRWAWPSLLLIFLLPVVFYQTVSTFRSRVDYIRYDWSHTFKGTYLPGGNDAIRVRSWQVARDLIRLHPVVGVGFGDIRSEMDATYQRLAPAIPTSDRIYPANEWAVYGVGAGWIGIIVFSIALIFLFFGSAADPFRWRSWVLATILPMVTDIGLEVQYGVFLVPFLLAWFRSVDGSKNPEIRVA